MPPDWHPPVNYLDTFLTDKPLEFAFNPRTGLVSLTIQAGFGQPNTDKAQIYMPIHVPMTPESAPALRDNLSNLEAIFDKAKQGRTKPHFLT